jgi:hypothetical protein
MSKHFEDDMPSTITNGFESVETKDSYEWNVA